MLGDNSPGVAHEELEDGELSGPQRDLGIAAPAAMLVGVESQVARLQLHRAFRRTATQQSPDPRDQDHVRERLAKEVIGAGVQRLGLVEVAVFGGQHEDRGPVALLAELAAQLVAVDAGQHDVQHDRVVGVLLCHPQPVSAVECDVDREPVGFQTAPQRGGQLLLVFDDEQSHDDAPHISHGPQRLSQLR